MAAVDIGQLVTAGIGALTAIGAFLAYFKYKPGQKERTHMDVAQGNINVAQGTLNIAQGSIELVTSTLEAQFKRMDSDMDELRAEHAEYRRDTQLQLNELGVMLRAEKAEKERVRQENEELKKRVSRLESVRAENETLRARVVQLEAEVEQLKMP